MRPDKPGYWWWEDRNGDNRIAEFGFYRGNNLTTEAEDCWFISPERFEEHMKGDFKRWIGQAHPPKHFNTMEIVPPLTSGGCNYRFPVRVVRFDDVKEFLIGGDDETE